MSEWRKTDLSTNDLENNCCSAVQFIWCSGKHTYHVHTVKPVLRGHLWDKGKVAF